MSDHMIETSRHHGHNFLYGVFINNILKHHQADLTGEAMEGCSKENEIGKATLTCIGLKKIVDG